MKDLFNSLESLLIMVLERLREQTRPYHDELERAPLLTKLVGHLSIDDYVSVLKKFYGYYYPLETQKFPAFLEKQPTYKFFFRPKMDLLKEDLSKFDVDLSQIPLCENLPAPKNPSGWLGVFYTLEGSCLGRKFLWPRIQKTLSLPEKMGTFFSSGKEDVRSKWKAFCDQMCEKVSSELQEKELIEGSIETFTTLNEWVLR